MFSVVNKKSYIGLGNTIKLLLQDNSSGLMSNTDFSSVTEVEIRGNDLSFNSTNNPDVISWDVSTSCVYLTLGNELAEGTYSFYVIVKDTSNPDGIVWDDLLEIKSVYL